RLGGGLVGGLAPPLRRGPQLLAPHLRPLSDATTSPKPETLPPATSTSQPRDRLLYRISGRTRHEQAHPTAPRCITPAAPTGRLPGPDTRGWCFCSLTSLPGRFAGITRRRLGADPGGPVRPCLVRQTGSVHEPNEPRAGMPERLRPPPARRRAARLGRSDAGA